jgi:hypothetical protein
VLGPVETGLPSRSRDVVETRGEKLIAHFELHRRHQSLVELAVDVGEAQIRLYRRESLEVVSLVWDLYGARDEPVIEEKTFAHGAKVGKRRSQVVYLRVNLRGMRYKELLAKAPPALWPLVALTRDGASEEAVLAAMKAIEARTDLTAPDHADHLAVLGFVGEAEDVPIRAMKEYLTQEKLMASTLYQEIFEKGEAKGLARGEVKHCAKMLVQHLTRRVGQLDPAVTARIRSVQDLDALDAWLNEALSTTDDENARRLIEKIARGPIS